jgi:plastocyanin
MHSVPVADDDNGPFPAAEFNVTDTNPVWVYCRQANHCQQGMVFAINPGNDFPAFKATAMGQGTSAPSSSLPPSLPTSTALSVAPSVVQTVTSTAVTFQSPSPTASSLSDPTSVASSGTPQTTVTAAEHLIVVGGPNTLTFSPSNITAQVGDTIVFQFKQKNHTVTQSTFAEPCISLTKTSTSGQVGFDSGL